MSHLYLEIKYARMVGQSIERWKVKRENPFHGNGRCPICGDSAVSKSKTRFHIIQHDDTLFVKCFNCDYSTNLLGFLKTYHHGLYSELLFERYRVDGDKNEPIITTKPKVFMEAPKTIPDRLFTLDLPLVSNLPENHHVRLYVASRKLPDYPFMYCEKFYEFSSQFNEDLKEMRTGRDEPRLIIPFYDKQGNVFAYQGRDLSGKSQQKYITIVINTKFPKIFGLDRVDFNKPIKIVEGPIDSLFLDNCLAAVNASLVSTATKLLKGINKTLDITLVYDNECRNAEIVKMYEAAIKAGFKIVIWNTSTDKKEDINDLVLQGKDVEKIIEKNTYSGLMAQLEFQRWKRI